MKTFYEILRESSVTSISLSDTFLGVSTPPKGLRFIRLTDDDIKTTLLEIKNTMGIGSKEAFNFKFSEEEQNSNNPKAAYIDNFATLVYNKLPYEAKEDNTIKERLRTILTSIVDNNGIF